MISRLVINLAFLLLLIFVPVDIGHAFYRDYAHTFNLPVQVGSDEFLFCTSS